MQTLERPKDIELIGAQRIALAATVFLNSHELTPRECVFAAVEIIALCLATNQGDFDVAQADAFLSGYLPDRIASMQRTRQELKDRNVL